METVLESKVIETLNNFNNNTSLKYYALYLLKLNRINSKAENGSQNGATIFQFLEKEATFNKDFSLTLILNNVPEKNESFLRENLAKKIEKGTLYASNIGTLSNFSLGFKKDDKNIESICYYYLYRENQEPNNEYLLCFLIDDSKYNLDLFRNELDYYVQEYLENHFENLDSANCQKLKDYLNDWYENSIDYLSRSIKLLNEDIRILIDEAFSCGQITLDSNLDERKSFDLNFLFKTFNCTYLAQNSIILVNNQNKKTIINESTQNNTIKLEIKWNSNTEKISFSKSECSKFSNDCSETLIKNFNEFDDVFQLKQIIENYKLKLAQELNIFNRCLRKAEHNYYDVYRVYMYLRSSSMSSNLMNMFKNNLNTNSKSATNLNKLFQVIIEFYEKKKI